MTSMTIVIASMGVFIASMIVFDASMGVVEALITIYQQSCRAVEGGIILSPLKRLHLLIRKGYRQ